MKLSKKQIVLIVVLTLFIAFSLFTLLPRNKQIAMNLNKEDANVKHENVSNNTSDPMKNLYSFSIKVDEELLQLPMSLSDLQKNGWQAENPLPDDPFLFIPLDHTIYKKNDLKIEMYYDSDEEYPLTMDHYYVSSLTFNTDEYKDNTITLPKDIVLGKANEDDITKAYGKVKDEFEDEEKGKRYLLYQYDKDQYINLILDKNDILQEVNMKYKKESITTTLPEVLKEQVNDAQLSTNISAESFGIENKVYHLPAAMKYVLADGWKNEEDIMIPSSENGLTSTILSKGDQLLLVEIKNYESSPQKIEDCYLVSAILDNDLNPTYKLNGNLSATTSVEELLQMSSSFLIKKEMNLDNSKIINIRIKTGPASQIIAYVDREDQNKISGYSIMNIIK